MIQGECGNRNRKHKSYQRSKAGVTAEGRDGTDRETAEQRAERRTMVR